MPEAPTEPFELQGFTPYLIARVGSLMERTITPALKQSSLTIDMWRVLMVLNFNGPVTLIELSRTTGVTTSTLSRLVGRMIDQALVSRRRSTKDTRTVRVQLRPQGVVLFQKLWPTVARLESQVTSRFGISDLRQLQSALRTIEGVLLHELETATMVRKDRSRTQSAPPDGLLDP